MIMMFVTFTSCDKVEDPNIGGTSVEAMSGDWYVQLLIDGEDAYGLGYMLISTYNTAADNGTEMWIDDQHNVWWFKAKTPVDINSLTFSGNDLPSSVDGYDITLNISNGIITKGDVLTEAGNPTDGISLDIEFSDDPGTIYQLVGYKRTGFAEDEH